MSTRTDRTTILLVGMGGWHPAPAPALGALGWSLGIGVTMPAAMMLPSAVPAAGQVARLARRTPTVLFVAGYLAVWTVYGLAAYSLYRLVTAFDTGWLAWNARGPYVAGAVIVAAGVYELTPLKGRSLRRCRNARHPDRALDNGLAHGVDCVT